MWADAAWQRLSQALDAARRPAGRGHRARHHPRRAGPALVEIANSGDDLLIVGAWRRGALTRMRYGKVSRCCLAQADVLGGLEHCAGYQLAWAS